MITPDNITIFICPSCKGNPPVINNLPFKQMIYDDIKNFGGYIVNNHGKFCYCEVCRNFKIVDWITNLTYKN